MKHTVNAEHKQLESQGACYHFKGGSLGEGSLFSIVIISSLVQPIPLACVKGLVCLVFKSCETKSAKIIT